MPSQSSTQSGAGLLIPQGSHAGAHAIELNRPAFVIGSRKDAVRLHLESSTVSKAHCVIVVHEWGCSIHDLGSRTHTIVNGQPITEVDLNDGDIINIGRFEFKYAAPRSARGAPRSAAPGELDVSTLTDPFRITKRVIQLGRRRGSDLEIEDRAISNIHAIIYERNGKRYVRDLTSRTGTWLNGKLVHQEEILPGAILKIGPVEIGYRIVDEPAEEISSFLPVPLEDEPLKIVDDELPPSIDVEIEAPIEDEIELGVMPPPQYHTQHDTLIPVDEAPAEPVSEAPAIPVEPEAEPLEIAEDIADAKTDEEEAEDALLALRKGWKGASSLPQDLQAAPFSEAPVDESPIEPVADVPLEAIVEPVAEAPIPVENDLPTIAPEQQPEEVSESPLELDDLLESIEPEPQVEEVKTDDSLDAILPEIAEPIADAPIVETPVEQSIEAPAAELDLDDLLESIEPEQQVEEVKTEDSLDAISPEIAEPIAEVPAIEMPAEPSIEAIEAPAAELDLDDLIADAPAPDDKPLDLDELENLLLEPAAESPAAEAPAVKSEDQQVLPPVIDVTDDDGVLDLHEEAPAPVADAIPEPDLTLESDDAGTIAPEPVTEQTAQAEPEVAEIDDLIEEDAFFEEAAEHPNAPLEIVDEHEDITEIAPPTMEQVEIVDDAGLPEIETIAPVGELPTETLFTDTPQPEIQEQKAPEPVLDLSMPPVPTDEVEHKSFDPATDDVLNIDDLIIEPDTSETPAPEAAKQAQPVDQVSLDDATIVDEGADDTAYAVGLEDLDPFDMDDEDPFEDAPAVVTPPVAEPVSEKSEEIIEPTVASPESALPTELDDASSADADLDDLLKDLGIEAEADLEGLPEGETGDLVEEHLQSITDEAQKTDQEIDDALEAKQPEKPSTSLNDLIPKDPPLMGGAFMGMPGGMALGGSPMVDLSRPVPPPRPQVEIPKSKSDDSQRAHRVGFTGPGAAPQQPGNPFSVSGKPISDVLIGRRAEKSVDVFASPSPRPEDLQAEAEIDLNDTATAATIDTTESSDEEALDLNQLSPESRAKTPEELEILRTADRYRPRGTIRAITDAPAPQPMQSPQPEPKDLAADRKKRLRRVFFCTLLTLPLAGLAAAIAWKMLPPTSRIEARITFKRLNTLSERDAANFRSMQDELLTDNATQVLATNLMDPSVKEMGFLGDTNKIHKTIEREPRIRWPEKPGDTMHLVMQSQTKAEDVARMRALASAIIKVNGDQVISHRELTRKISDQEADIQQLQARLKSVSEDLKSLADLGNERPDDQTINETIAKARTLENELKDVRARRMDTESAIESIKRTPFTELAKLEDEQFYSADEDLKKLVAQLDEIQKTYKADTEAGDKQLKSARASLDELIKKFEQSLEAAPKAANVPANLAKYVDGAKRVFKQTRDLTDELLRRQEQQKTRLSELKTRLSTKIEQHTHSLLEKDEDLKKLNDSLEMYKRQYNAAIAEGVAEEAKKLSTQMQLHQTLIDARVDRLKNDPVYFETITSIQQIIDQTEKSIQEDRKHVDQVLNIAQDEFTKTAPEIATLPEEQKEVAASIDTQLKAISEARKSYTKAADEAETANAVREQQYKDMTASIQDKIRERKTMVLALARDDQASRAEKARKEKLDGKGKELELLVKQEDAINKNLETLGTQQQKMQEVRRKLIENDQIRAEKLSEKGRIEAEIRSKTADLNNKRNQIASKIIPEEQFELLSYDDSEVRPWLRPAAIGGSAGGVFLLMLIPIVWNLMLASRDSHQLARVQETKSETPNPEPAPASKNGHAPVEDSEVLNP